MTEQRISALESEVAHTRATSDRIERRLESIDENLKILVRIEERQIAASQRMDAAEEVQKEHGTRLSVIEVKMPGLLESRRWIVGGVLASVGMIGIALAHTVLK